jgi:recombination protein RecT
MTKQGVAVQRTGVPEERALTTGEVKSELEAIRPQLEEVLPAKMDPDRFLRVVTGAVLKNSDLLKCDRISLFRAVLEAAQLGLEPTGLLGSAYLVPYRVNGRLQATLIPGYRGLIDLARRSGEIESIYAQVVHAKDYFRIRQGTEPGIDHETYIPPADADPGSEDPERAEAADPGPIIGAYMVAVLRDRSGNPSVRQIEWMTRAEIEAVRKRSRASASGPWVSDWSEMARKTVVRRGAKYLPLTPEAVRAFSLDEEAERIADAAAQRRESGRAGLLRTLSGRAGTAQEAAETVEEGETRDEGVDDRSVAPVGADEQTYCGADPGENPLGMSHPCTLEPGHRGTHASDEGSWPQ